MRGIAAALIAASVLVVGGAADVARAGASESCPNATLREEDDSTALPDCRAYEMVSPPEKNGYDVGIAANGQPAEAAPAAPSGDRVSFFSLGSFAGNPAGIEFNQYLSVRAASGWITEGLSPPKQANFSGLDVHSGFLAFSEDLSTAVVQNWVSPGYGLYRREADGSQMPIARPLESASSFAELSFRPISFGPNDMASADLSHIVFESQEALTEDAPESEWKAYEWAGGKLSLVSVLPDGTPTTLPNNDSVSISADGSRVFWTDGTEYFVTEEDGTTTAIPGYGWPTPNGSRVFFVSGGELVEYELEAGRERDLAPDTADPGGAEVQALVGASADRSYLYFVAQGDLAAGATTGEDNLYAWHEGAIAFVATLNSADLLQLANGNEAGNTHLQVSPDGSALLFRSTASLTGYENEGYEEYFLYDASSGGLTCVTCNPSGEAASGNAQLGNVAGPVTGQYMAYKNVTEDGRRVFFQTPEALLPDQDTDGAEDVYEWEAEGAGSCQVSTDPNGGCLYLISSGRDGSGSYFENATPSGEDVFFITRQRLVGQDLDEDVDLYDARVNGGFPAPSVPASPCVEASSCRSAPPPTSLSTALGSELTGGVGNLAPAVEPGGKGAKSQKQKPKSQKEKLTRQQKLERALRKCAGKPKRERDTCRAAARKRFRRRSHGSARERATARRAAHGSVQERAAIARSGSKKKGSGR